MSLSRKAKKEVAIDRDGARQQSPPPIANSSRRRWKRSIFQPLAVIGAPLVLFGLVELGLKLAGFGYRPGFLLPARSGDRATFVQNNQFSWRFFGQQMSRLPSPFSITQTKPRLVIRNPNLACPGCSKRS
jgi:hypothetical protein